MDEMRQRIRTEALRYACGRAIHCYTCGAILDAARAVAADLCVTYHAHPTVRACSIVRCAACWDSQWPALEREAREKGYTWDILDGRALCPEPARKRPARAALGLPAEERRGARGIVRARPLAERVRALLGARVRVTIGRANILVYAAGERAPRRRVRLCQRARAESRYGSGAGWSMATAESVALSTLMALPDVALDAWFRSALRGAW